MVRHLYRLELKKPAMRFFSVIPRACGARRIGGVVRSGNRKLPERTTPPTTEKRSFLLSAGSKGAVDGNTQGQRVVDTRLFLREVELELVVFAGIISLLAHG